MEIPSLDIWTKFEDLYPLTKDGYEETLFDDIFNVSVLDKHIVNENGDSLEDNDNSLQHLNQALSELDFNLLNDADLKLDSEYDLLFPSSLGNECDITHSVLHDHSYSEGDHYNSEVNENKKIKGIEMETKQLTVDTIKKHQQLIGPKIQKRSLLKRKYKYTTRLINIEKYNEKVHIFSLINS